MTISIPNDKLCEIKGVIEKLLTKKTITRKKLESIIGKLSYIADCIRSARLFIARLLALLRTVSHKGHHINLNGESKKDLKWFLKFMTRFNGKTTIPEHIWTKPDQLIQTDASLSGIGGIFYNSCITEYFHCDIHTSWSGHHISVYELLAVLISFKVWGKKLQNKRIVLQCDNSSSVSLLNTETVSDEWLSLRRKARSVLKAAFRPGTFKNLRTQLNTYLLFCEKFCRSAFPVDQETLCGYVCFLSDNFKNSGSVRNYLSGVKTWAILLNFDTEEFNSPSLRLTLSGIDKLNANVPNIKLPFEPYHLNCMFEVLDMTSVQDAVMWAVIMISFYAMLRKSQFANNSRTTFNPKEQLTRGDIQITEEGLIIDIQWSKTSQKHKKYSPYSS
ncbi:unnamed protein product [Mytilus edulis]|uniref:Uncharacterized protein n=1 Tax=Mytilus edulis TaxID=6550 RepID=A0A8S3SHB6_MYTED|nr:unnamed protein product [Mytilus edulis]